MIVSSSPSLSMKGSAVDVSSVFSTYLYTGNGSTQTINNGIDLATDGGMVWIKQRSSTQNNFLCDTDRGAGKYLYSDSTDAERDSLTTLNSFNIDGYTLGGAANITNQLSATYASWTFKKQPRFFDMVKYTGNGVAGREIPHELGCEVGMIIVKCTTDAYDWAVYHKSLANTEYVKLNTTDAKFTSSSNWNNTTPTDTLFTIGSGTMINGSGKEYIAYLFAHDPLGESGEGDGLIACGSFTTDGSGNASVDLGWEPQYVMRKIATSANNWVIGDTMRGMDNIETQELFPNGSFAEGGGGGTKTIPTATGFRVEGMQAGTHIYMAIRRPMKEPESSSEVFAVDIANGNGSATSPEFFSGFPVDMSILRQSKTTSGGATSAYSRLTGSKLQTYSTVAEASGYSYDMAFNTGFYAGGLDSSNLAWMFKRAKGFFDVVAYTGDGVAGRTVNHNLGVEPEMMIGKCRSNNNRWQVYHKDLGATKFMELETTNGSQTATWAWNDTPPSESTFVLGTSSYVNYSTYTYIMYLFATLAGISKVGSYTGNGTSQTIDCGFTTGAKFVLVKRTDSTGDWVFADSTRGITTGNVPYLKLNTTDAEDTDEDCFDPDASGFIVNQTSTSNLNVNGGSYVYYSISN